MELYQVRYFVAVCETLNFARAAERCGVSPSSLTRAVQKLEHEMGGLLVRREGRLTHLTDLGRLVRPMLEEVLAHANSTKSAARGFLKTGRKPMELGVMSSVGPVRFAPFLARFSARFPDIELVLVQGGATQLEGLLLGGSLDVALASHLRGANGRLRHHKLYRERAVIVFPERHRFAGQETVRLADLREERLLLRTHCEKRALLVELCRKQGFEPHIVCRSEREDWVEMMVAAGAGVTLMPENLHIGLGTLARPLVEPTFERDISVVAVAGRRQSLPVQNFVRAIRAHDWTDASPSKDRHLPLGRRYNPGVAWEVRAGLSSGAAAARR
jgi:DNA-binding transcriptional LysR family regulator